MPTHQLVGVLGKTPQILTETMFALCVVRLIPIRDVCVMSTQDGAETTAQYLLDPASGMLEGLGREYPDHCGQIRFTERDIYVATDGLAGVADIRSREDSERFLELILKILWQQSADKDSVLYCSLAGGG